MKDNWESHYTWIAHFDILGFKSLIDQEYQSLTIESLKSNIDEVISKLEKEIESHGEHIDFHFFADTFIIFSKNDKINDYPALISVSKSFINSCTYIRLPVRGAISFGSVQFGHQKKIIIGKAFLEAHEYSEDQNWIGLILTPSATKELNLHNLNPNRHGFVNKDIPLRKYSDNKEKVYAYRFINGSTNFECTLLPALNEMLHFAPENQKEKYSNTINFIKKYYTVHTI